jgi:hypothetical protein
MLESAATTSLSQASPATDFSSFPDFSDLSDDLRERLYQFLLPLLTFLDRQIDVRLVRTLWQTVEAMIRFRNRAHGLLLSELGGYLLSPAHAPAGTKRLSNLLRCSRWSSDAIDDFLWQQAKERQEALAQEGKPVLLLWDESVIEKPESLKAEGLCPVRSAKAARLKRIKPGFYTPPTGSAAFVPGIGWIGLLIISMAGPPTVAAMRWFTTRLAGAGKVQASDARKVQYDLLVQCARHFGKTVLHVFDRGYAGAPWLGALHQHKVRFLLRWPKHYHLLAPAHQGQEMPAWQIARGQTTWDERQLWDARKHRLTPVGVLAMNVQHPKERGALWLVAARRGKGSKGQEPWYLLTNEPVTNAEEAWQVVMAYARRYQIEMAFRFGKSELALESPRLWTWERRLKLMLMVTLAYAFLLTLLDESLIWLKEWLLKHFCHRTGKKNKEAAAPLYRLRDALSKLWSRHRENPELYATNEAQSSG